MYTIKDITNGKCAIINDGTIEQLKEVLHTAFPLDRGVIGGNNKIYMASTSSPGFWHSSNTTNLPTQSVKDFSPPQLKRGDYVYVSDNSIEHALKSKNKRIFMAEIKGANFPYICIDGGDEKKFQTNQKFGTSKWIHAVKVPEVKEVELTVQEVEKLLKEQLGEITLKIIK